ncbi:DgyrCDS4816 [Dimorphilus gyrociliatus]|uniref:DgyrCDS4816 n=1 Tax=Dimorphilus gyrociliatus TaxID=2664684 RepID=A0A7I8VMT1_9ANNE|nr:DgyrCDS4816 [Dimorphilus gyrociliatus]
MDPTDDIMIKYKNIAASLKKRFLRKPNLSEGADHFSREARILRDEECFEYSAFFSLAQARCEHTLPNYPGEADALICAAQSFLEAHMLETELNCPSFRENLLAASNCFDHAIRVYIENNERCLAASLCIQMGDTLRKLHLPDEAINHYENAMEHQKGNVTVVSQCFRDIASCNLEIKNYETALKTLTDLATYLRKNGHKSSSGKVLGESRDILCEAEINRILILMLTEPMQSRLHPANASLMETYSWLAEDYERDTFLPKNMFLLLQSAFMANQARDFEALSDLSQELSPFLNVEQKQLFSLILSEHCR